MSEQDELSTEQSLDLFDGKITTLQETPTQKNAHEAVLAARGTWGMIYSHILMIGSVPKEVADRVDASFLACAEGFKAVFDKSIVWEKSTLSHYQDLMVTYHSGGRKAVSKCIGAQIET